ncbi:thioesterase family protein [Nocardioides sp. YIM 152588]|uniref:acyl-CoA thioesterase n=1 Tax=Nocardioides sp. YIM 152588 TaxID=3158259 RepID=UPI0032E3D398
MVFDCEIQARLRDVNLGGHVDNVEAMRVLDEARLLYFRHAPLPGGDGRPGLLRDLPEPVTMLIGSQRAEYHAEMRFQPFQPFLVRMWVAHVGRSSITVDYELRVAPDHAPAVTAESTLVLWDTRTDAAWPVSDEVRATLESYRNDPVEFRPRPVG